MTLEQTRQMGIEFERRIQTIDPTTEVVAKMETDDIYSYLNQFQLQYIKTLYLADQQAEQSSNQSAKIQDVLKTLVQTVKISKSDITQNDDYNIDVVLPNNYFQYISSSSDITSNYKSAHDKSTTPNMLVKWSDAQKMQSSFYDKFKILRNPVCCLKNGMLNITHDLYTDIDRVSLTYIRKPLEFSIISDIACELPYECFEDLVSGAVELYFAYKYKVSLASQAAKRNATRRELGTDNQTNQTE